MNKGSICYHEKREKLVKVIKYCCDGFIRVRTEIDDQCAFDGDYIFEKSQVIILTYKIMCLLLVLLFSSITLVVLSICVCRCKLKIKQLTKQADLKRYPNLFYKNTFEDRKIEMPSAPSVYPTLK